MKIQWNSRVVMIAICLMLVLASLPVVGQDDGELIIVSGELDVTHDGDLVVGDYVIAVSSAFVPADVSEGDYVIVTGELLDDGETVQAVSVELFESGDEDGESVLLDPANAGSDDGGDQPGNRGRGNQGRDGNDDDGGQDNGNRNGNSNRNSNANNNRNGNANSNRNGNANSNRNGNANGRSGDNSNRPVAIPGQSDRDRGRGDSNRGRSCDADSDFENSAAQRIADEFEGIDYDSVIAAFCDGAGMGEVMLSLRLAEIGGGSYAGYLQERADGKGWGQIMRDAEVHPSEAAAGRGRGRGNQNRNANGRSGNRGNDGDDD